MDRRPWAIRLPWSIPAAWRLPLLAFVLAACDGGGGSGGAVGGAPGEPPGPPPPATGSATISWFAPTLREDGTPLDNLDGFRIYYGRSVGTLQHTRIEVRNPSAITWTVTGLTSGTWYFAVTAFDQDGIESRLSNVASKSI